MNEYGQETSYFLLLGLVVQQRNISEEFQKILKIELPQIFFFERISWK